MRDPKGLNLGRILGNVGARYNEPVSFFLSFSYQIYSQYIRNKTMASVIVIIASHTEKKKEEEEGKKG